MSHITEGVGEGEPEGLFGKEETLAQLACRESTANRSPNPYVSRATRCMKTRLLSHFLVKVTLMFDPLSMTTFLLSSLI
jgi:hypothetical protein